jgi:hypothetical protein
MSYSAALTTTPNDVNSGASSPLGALAQWNEAQKGGLQNQQLGLQNQQLGLMLGLRGQLAGLVGVGPNGQPLPPGQAPGAMGGGGAPGADPLASAGITQVSPYGVTTPFGPPAPRGLVIGAIMSNDPAKSMAEIYNMGRQRVTQIMTEAGDPNDPDPVKAAQARAMVKAGAGQLYTEGWIEPRAYQTLMSDPSKAGSFIMGTASPDAHLSAVKDAGLHGMTWQDGKMVYDPNAAAGLATTGAQVAGAEAGARRTVEINTTLTTIPHRNADGSYSEEQVPLSDALRRARGGTSAATGGGGQNAASVITGADGQPSAGVSPYASWTQQREGGAPGVTNARSTATGPQQFTEGTWLETFKAAAPSIAEGKSDAQILALRNNPQWSAAMTDYLGDKNAEQLKSLGIEHTIAPNGQPYNAAVGLAHFFGAAGAGKILSADSATPMTTLFPPVDGKTNPVIEANPNVAGKTAGDVVRPYADKFGVQPYVSGGAAPAAADGGATGSGGIVGAPKPTEGQKAGIEIDKTQVEKDAGTVGDAQTAAMRAQASTPVLLDLRAKADNIGAGAFGETRASLLNILKTFGPDWSQSLLKATAGLDTSKVGDQQEFIKQAFAQVTAAESQLAGARVGAMLTSYFAKAMPNISMQPEAIKSMANFLLTGNQMIRDYAQDSATYYNSSRDQWRGNPVSSPYQPLTKFDQGWTAPGSIHAPQVYEAAANLLNGKDYASIMRGLTHEQSVEVYKTAHRADPGARFSTSQMMPAQ